MSRRELGRVEVLARVRSGQLRLVDAAVLLRLSYRQTKRLWKRYREEGAAGLKHRSAGRRSHRAYAEKFREKVLALVREKYGGPVGERFGPTLAAEHLASEDGQRVDAETLRRWMREEGLWSRERGEEPITQFGRMCAKLGIELIAASSPQAKGRVERIHGTHQDRLVKKLRRKKIASHAEANAYLEAEYLPEHNRRFARPAARREDYHRRAPCAAKLDRIFRLESQRTISDDWVVRYDNRFFQLDPQSRNYAPARGKVEVCEWPEGRVDIEYRGRAVPWREIAAPARPRVAERTGVPAPPLAKRKWVPLADHPWRQAIRREVERRAAVAAPSSVAFASPSL